MASWTLRDSSETAREFKYTFFKPSEADIAQIKPGENVKLVFDFSSLDPEAPEAERMWVIVEQIRPDGTFVGSLDNTPRWIKDLQPGDTIEFDARHIINTEHDNPDNIVNRYRDRCFVTNRILCDGHPIGYLYREEPDTEQDSGWRFLAGDESDDYMNGAENLAFVSIGAVLNKDDSALDLLEEPVGSAFERNAASGRFHRVEG